MMSNVGIEGLCPRVISIDAARERFREPASARFTLPRDDREQPGQLSALAPLL
jgi:hypothetical protein